MEEGDTVTLLAKLTLDPSRNRQPGSWQLHEDQDHHQRERSDRSDLLQLSKKICLIILGKDRK